MNLLLLGGTTEATAFARRLGDRPDIRATLSLAGRTRRPLASGLATRSGGFGGAAGLSAYLVEHGIDAVIDATHPFAARISANAATACTERGVPLARLSRPAWEPAAGDRWMHVSDLDDAARVVADLGPRIFLSVGGYSLSAFEAVPGKTWLVRSIDPPEPAPAFDDWRLIQARGPFALADERALLREHAIDAIVTKNSGAAATRAKLDAARELGRPVVMIERPALPAVDAAFDDPEAALAWLDAGAPVHSSAG